MTLVGSKVVTLCFIVLMPPVPLMSQSDNASATETPGLAIRWSTSYPRGWRRMGAMGHGEFFGYSFGRTIYCETNNTVSTMAPCSFVVNKINPAEDQIFFLKPIKIDSILLWCTKGSNRLARIDVQSRPISQSEAKRLLQEIRKEIDYEFAIDLIPVSTNMVCSGKDEIMLYESRDMRFSIGVFICTAVNSLVRIRVDVICKEIIPSDGRCCRPTQDDCIRFVPKLMFSNDVDVSVGDL